MSEPRVTAAYAIFRRLERLSHPPNPGVAAATNLKPSHWGHGQGVQSAPCPVPPSFGAGRRITRAKRFYASQKTSCSSVSARALVAAAAALLICRRQKAQPKSSNEASDEWDDCICCCRAAAKSLSFDNQTDCCNCEQYNFCGPALFLCVWR